MKQGLIHLYTGDGKGKTTAAVGLSVRAAGNGMRVWFLQFMKGRPSGEIAVLERLPGVTVRRGECQKFSFQMTEEEKKAVRFQQDELLREAVSQLEEIDLLVLDEVTSAISTGLLGEEDLKKLLTQKPPQLELVLTGRDPADYMIEAADYLTQMVKQKHPYDRGIAARRGIEQ